MLLINCKVELKLRCTKNCILASNGVENDSADSNNIIFFIKDTKLYVPVVNLSAKDNQKLSHFLAKDLKDKFLGINIRQKVRIEIQLIDSLCYFF